MVLALSALFIILSIALIVLILMHSGKDAGLSGAFGVGAASSDSGASTAVMERNLNRVTVVVALLFVADAIVLVNIW